MRMRRIRTAAWTDEEANAKCNDYINDLIEYLREWTNNLVNGVDAKIGEVKSKLAEVNKDDGSDVNRSKALVKDFQKSVTELINGSADFEGLSNVPETPGYAAFFDDISKEYSNPGRESGALFESTDAIKDFLWNDFQKYYKKYKELEKSFDKFFNEIKKKYDRKYADSWEQFKKAIMTLCEECGVFIENAARKANDGDDNLETICANTESNLAKKLVDVKYYLSELQKFESEASVRTGENLEKMCGDLIKIIEPDDGIIGLIENSIENLRGSINTIKKSVPPTAS